MIVLSSLQVLLFGLIVGTSQHLCYGLLTPNQSPYGMRPSVATTQESRHLRVLAGGTPILENDKASDLDSEEIFVVTFPPIIIATAFLTYDDVANLFHDFVVTASGRTFEFVE